MQKITGWLAAALAAACVTACTPAQGFDREPAPEPPTASPPTAQVAEVPQAPTTEKPGPAPRKPGRRPNIVLVQMDDFSMDLARTMRTLRTFRREGAVYDHFVVDSLCCVSRASLFTGQYPHQTGVRTNTAGNHLGGTPLGGYEAFRRFGGQQRSVNVALQRSGYTTGYVGKYLNEYEYVPGVRPLPAAPPGWSQFHVLFGSAYDGWGFDSTEVVGGSLRARHHPRPSASASRATKDASYAGQVIEDYAVRFIRQQRGRKKPYFLHVAPYAPHNRTNPEGAWPGEPVFPAAFRDRPGGAKPGGNCGPVTCRSLTTKTLPGYGDARADNRPRLKNGRRVRAWNTVPTMPRDRATTNLRQRAQMVQSVDRTLRRILRLVDDDTYVIITSDNGFHLGQLGMAMGKGTAYDTDVRVPLMVIGPGVRPGKRSELTSNIDLAPTFEELAGLKPARFRAGTSLVPTFQDPSVDRRGHVFVEHTSAVTGNDPDLAYTGGELQRIPSYVAVRSRTGLLVRVDTDPRAYRTRHAYEFYDYRRQGWERVNRYGRKKYADEIAALTQRLEAFDACRTVTGGKAVPPRCRRLHR